LGKTRKENFLALVETFPALQHKEKSLMKFSFEDAVMLSEVAFTMSKIQVNFR